MNIIQDNLKSVKERVARAAERSGRSAGDITLVAVSKQMPPDRMREAYEAGARVFGENHAQELRDKRPLLPPDCSWHFIGRMQSNKVKYLVGRAALIQSVDSIGHVELIERLSGDARTTSDILVQINLAGEAQKGGVPAGAAEDFVSSISRFEHVCVKGIMTIPPVFDREENSRAYFREMKMLFERLKLSFADSERTDLKILSMGMSADFETAIEEGSNMVRVGSAIFGPRNK